MPIPTYLIDFQRFFKHLSLGNTNSFKKDGFFVSHAHARHVTPAEVIFIPNMRWGDLG